MKQKLYDLDQHYPKLEEIMKYCTDKETLATAWQMSEKDRKVMYMLCAMFLPAKQELFAELMNGFIAEERTGQQHLGEKASRNVVALASVYIRRADTAFVIKAFSECRMILEPMISIMDSELSSTLSKSGDMRASGRIARDILSRLDQMN